MLLLILAVAIFALVASYTFVTIQQTQSLYEKFQNIKNTHRNSATLLFEQHLQEQILSAEEVVMLSELNSKTVAELEQFFKQLWPRIQLSYLLSSMSFNQFGEDNVIEFGSFPYTEMNQMQIQAAESLRPQSGIVCHLLCELSATIPVNVNGERWSFSILTDIAPSIIFLNSVVGSDIGIISPNQDKSTTNYTLSRYVVEVITGTENNAGLFEVELTENEINKLEDYGLQVTTNEKNYFIWFETINGINDDVNLLFIREISPLLAEQSNQKQQVLVIFGTLTFGILFFLILFSIIPISRINKLKRAITLIGTKEYDVARFRLGAAKNTILNDELNELEDEFRHTIDLLENYETELQNSQKKLVRQATIDSTTGLYTRSVLVENLGAMNFDSNTEKVAIFFLDLDGFKPINDNLGHEAGDIMLKKIGYRLQGVRNKNTKVYRIGGDEFVICYRNYGSESALEKMASSVVDLFAAPFHIYDNSISISTSIGIISQDSNNNIDADELLRYADIAMYQAKKGGKNRYEFFNQSMRDATQQRFIVKNDFITALEDNQLFIVYQPIVDSQTKEVVKLEALCRWDHPELGFIPPPIFIDVLEESENMNTLFRWIVKNVMQEIQYLDSVGKHDISISLNLSTSQLVDDTALDVLKRLGAQYKVSPARVELEITETSLITNFAQAKKWVEEATNAGFKIAIDDFGAGYSSLSYLTAFPYNTVKLDRSLLNNIDKDKMQQRIIGSLTQLLHGLSVPIVAEGAETSEQFSELSRLGCDYIQGFVISRPIPHDKLAVFLETYMIEQLTIIDEKEETQYKN